MIKTWHDEGLTEHMSEDEVQKILNIIQKYGLPYHFGNRRTIEESYRTENEPNLPKFYKREQMNILIGRRTNVRGVRISKSRFENEIG